ncbi:hypothetical protein H696_05119 [Fonticula alba]|uniref:Uncharacterized protein n=1 Tax=Fonticula alba TaxID=691883 RepID=A0A058Z1P9_FONAL|nr:hypothetical protein H696_05119 [Fonticula alba]KCV68190.1 hypothetical protein H696_05119 [Fonticula alba]|eukprot:XP_009497244.1 hypothetical protein H696_05119 [Fonticula alba]
MTTTSEVAADGPSAFSFLSPAATSHASSSEEDVSSAVTPKPAPAMPAAQEEDSSMADEEDALSLALALAGVGDDLDIDYSHQPEPSATRADDPAEPGPGALSRDASDHQPPHEVLDDEAVAPSAFGFLSAGPGSPVAVIPDGAAVASSSSSIALDAEDPLPEGAPEEVDSLPEAPSLLLLAGSSGQLPLPSDAAIDEILSLSAAHEHRSSPVSHLAPATPGPIAKKPIKRKKRSQAIGVETTAERPVLGAAPEQAAAPVQAVPLAQPAGSGAPHEQATIEKMTVRNSTLPQPARERPAIEEPVHMLPATEAAPLSEVPAIEKSPRAQASRKEEAVTKPPHSGAESPEGRPDEAPAVQRRARAPRVRAPSPEPAPVPAPAPPQTTSPSFFSNFIDKLARRSSSAGSPPALAGPAADESAPEPGARPQSASQPATPSMQPGAAGRRPAAAAAVTVATSPATPPARGASATGASSPVFPGAGMAVPAASAPAMPTTPTASSSSDSLSRRARLRAHYSLSSADSEDDLQTSEEETVLGSAGAAPSAPVAGAAAGVGPVSSSPPSSTASGPLRALRQHRSIGLGQRVLQRLEAEQLAAPADLAEPAGPAPVRMTRRRAVRPGVAPAAADDQEEDSLQEVLRRIVQSVAADTGAASLAAPADEQEEHDAGDEDEEDDLNLSGLVVRSRARPGPGPSATSDTRQRVSGEARLRQHMLAGAELGLATFPPGAKLSSALEAALQAPGPGQALGRNPSAEKRLLDILTADIQALLVDSPGDGGAGDLLGEGFDGDVELGQDDDPADHPLAGLAGDGEEDDLVGPGAGISSQLGLVKSAVARVGSLLSPAGEQSPAEDLALVADLERLTLFSEDEYLDGEAESTAAGPLGGEQLPGLDLVPGSEGTTEGMTSGGQWRAPWLEDSTALPAALRPDVLALDNIEHLLLLPPAPAVGGSVTAPDTGRRWEKLLQGASPAARDRAMDLLLSLTECEVEMSGFHPPAASIAASAGGPGPDGSDVGISTSAPAGQDGTAEHDNAVALLLGSLRTLARLQADLLRVARLGAAAIANQDWAEAELQEQVLHGLRASVTAERRKLLIILETLREHHQVRTAVLEAGAAVELELSAGLAQLKDTEHDTFSRRTAAHAARLSRRQTRLRLLTTRLQNAQTHLASHATAIDQATGALLAEAAAVRRAEQARRVELFAERSALRDEILELETRLAGLRAREAEVDRAIREERAQAVAAVTLLSEEAHRLRRSRRSIAQRRAALDLARRAEGMARDAAQRDSRRARRREAHRSLAVLSFDRQSRAIKRRAQVLLRESNLVRDYLHRSTAVLPGVDIPLTGTEELHAPEAGVEPGQVVAPSEEVALERGRLNAGQAARRARRLHRQAEGVLMGLQDDLRDLETRKIRPLLQQEQRAAALGDFRAAGRHRQAVEALRAGPERVLRAQVAHLEGVVLPERQAALLQAEAEWRHAERQMQDLDCRRSRLALALVTGRLGEEADSPPAGRAPGIRPLRRVAAQQAAHRTVRDLLLGEHARLFVERALLETLLLSAAAFAGVRDRPVPEDGQDHPDAASSADDAGPAPEVAFDESALGPDVLDLESALEDFLHAERLWERALPAATDAAPSDSNMPAGTPDDTAPGEGDTHQDSAPVVGETSEPSQTGGQDDARSEEGLPADGSQEAAATPTDEDAASQAEESDKEATA